MYVLSNSFAMLEVVITLIPTQRTISGSRSVLRYYILLKLHFASVNTEEEEEETEEDDATDACKHCDKSNVLKRKPRDMQVHYGLIASGYQVIKDSKHRDKLNKDLGGNVLCIEMEAAGILNNFPCLVIRGICDYSDSHKNKAWQEYAAAVAAAYAKELLVFVQPTELQGERRIKDVLNEGQLFGFGFAMILHVVDFWAKLTCREQVASLSDVPRLIGNC